MPSLLNDNRIKRMQVFLPTKYCVCGPCTYLWHSGTLALWHSGTLALWHSGTGMCSSGILIYLLIWYRYSILCR